MTRHFSRIRRLAFTRGLHGSPIATADELVWPEWLIQSKAYRSGKRRSRIARGGR